MGFPSSSSKLVLVFGVCGLVWAGCVGRFHLKAKHPHNILLCASLSSIPLYCFLFRVPRFITRTERARFLLASRGPSYLIKRASKLGLGPNTKKQKTRNKNKNKKIPFLSKLRSKIGVVVVVGFGGQHRRAHGVRSLFSFLSLLSSKNKNTLPLSVNSNSIFHALMRFPSLLP